MRDAVGGSLLLNVVVIFVSVIILFFAGIMAYSKAYKAKKKTQGTHYCVIPRVPKSLVGLPSLHLSAFS